MKSTLLFIFAIAAAGSTAAAGTPPAASGTGSAPPSLGEMHANARSVPKYEKFELSFDAGGSWSNPFDPDQVAIDCLVDPPRGRSFAVPAFFFQDYRREGNAEHESLTPIGASCWKVRFTPTEPGTYRYRIRLNNRGRIVESAPGAFECGPDGGRPGFVRVSPVNPRYFQHDDGSPFFVVGENMLCPEKEGTYEMDRWLGRLAGSGGNFIRTWWCYGGTDLESRAATQPRRGLGVYDMESAWRADHELDLAERLGIEVMPTLETQQFLRVGLWWEDFTYNAAKGGPLAKPADYFTSPEAAAFFRKRLRYIVARWSYSTAIFSWMFWNEVDTCNDYNPAAVARWHVEMADYLRSIDPNRHIINTNYGNMDGRAEVDDLPQIGLVATNLYTRFDSASSALWASRFMSARRAKPYLLTEFGLGHYDRWAENDPEGIALHDGLWGCAFGGAAGGALVWEWNDWVDPQNLYHLYRPFAAMMKTIPFDRFAWKPVEVDSLAFRDPARRPYYASVFFEGFSTNYQFNTCPTPRPNTFVVTPEGNVDHPECFNGALAPASTPDGALDGNARNDAATATRDSSCTLLITMPRDGRLILHVPRLSGEQHPILDVTVDGRLALHQPLSRGNPAATWDYFGQFPIPLAAGPHRVTVANTRRATADNFWSDRVTVAYELTRYRERHGPNLECVGLQSKACILLWLRNPESNWLFARLGRKPAVQPEGLLRLRHIPDGTYAFTWIDTFTGDVLRRDSVRAQGGLMTLVTPSFARSAAAKLVRISGS